LLEKGGKNSDLEAHNDQFLDIGNVSGVTALNSGSCRSVLGIYAYLLLNKSLKYNIRYYDQCFYFTHMFISDSCGRETKLLV